MKRRIKAIIMIFMVVALLIGSAKRAEAAAEAGALAIVGGSVAGGGIGAAITAVAPVAAVIAAVALAGVGIYVLVSDDAENAGMTKTEFIEQKMQEYCDLAGQEYDRFCKQIATGAKVFSDGTIEIANTASDLISNWINYLINYNQIHTPLSYDKVIDINGVYVPVLGLNDVCNYIISNTSVYTIQNIKDEDVAMFAYTMPNGYYRVMALSAQKISYYLFINGVKRDEYYNRGILQQNGLYTFVITDIQNIENVGVPIAGSEEQVINYISGLNGSLDVNNAGQVENTFAADSTVDSSIFDTAEGDVIVLDPGMDFDGIASSYGKDGQITIDNYLQSLQRAINGVENNTIAINDTLTGVLENVAVGAYDPVADSSIASEDEENLVGVFTPAIDWSLNPSGVQAENSLNGLTFDLTEIFPFCIPFDLVALVQKFDVQREIPKMNVSLPLPGLETTLDLDLDLTPFDTLAYVLRTMELIAFIVGLAMVTRNIIRG